MTWHPIVGKAFTTPPAFAAYVDSVKFGLWRPRFVVVHNTSAPDLATYAGHWTRSRPITDEEWMHNLVGFYRDQMGWSAGPHLFVTPRSICCFSPLTGPGVHSPSWNAISWGVETVGEFEKDPFDGTIRANLVAALAILHAKAGLAPDGLRFHKEDPRTTHKSCPGRHMVKADVITAINDYTAHQHGGEHPPPPARPPAPPTPHPATPTS